MLRTQSSPDVIVIGGGVIGLATALDLLKSGMRVNLLERNRIGRGGASWAGGGILSPLQPDTLDEEVWSLLIDSLSRYADWCGELQDRSGVDPEYLISGLEVLQAADPNPWESFASRCALALQFADADTDGRPGSFHLPQIAQVRSPRLLAALAQAFTRSGGKLLEGHNVDHFIGDERVRGVVCANQSFPSGAVVLAAGAWSSQLDASCEIDEAKGQMLAFEAAPGELQSICLQGDQYLIPRKDGLIIAGSTLEAKGLDDDCTDQAREEISEAAFRMAPWLEGREVLHQWSGLRPVASDEKPVFGWSSRRDGLFHATGHYRLGITLAPGVAARAASLIA